MVKYWDSLWEFEVQVPKVTSSKMKKKKGRACLLLVEFDFV